jgi:hypothetical protein
MNEQQRPIITLKMITDIAGKTHDVIIRQREGSFIARTRACDNYGDGKSALAASNELLVIINHNHPQAFEKESHEKQELVLAWIRNNFRAGTRSNAESYSSYFLKHVVEDGIGEYVGNGELKGAMLKAGFVRGKDSEEYDTNWGFTLQIGIRRK